MSSDAAKRALRKTANEVRETLDASVCAHAGRRIADVFSALPEFSDLSRFAIFASMGGEPDTRPLFELIVDSGREALLPRCVEGGRLEFRRVEAWSALEPGRFGILEPGVSAERVPATSIDLFLVPGLAFDRQGARLGRGGGYYDRSLPSSARVWGLAFESQWVAAVPMETHDVPVEAVLTEAGLTVSERTG